MTQPAEKTPLYARYALALVMVVYILNFLDRTIIYILFPLIKKEMAFSDTQLALLGDYYLREGSTPGYCLLMWVKINSNV